MIASLLSRIGVEVWRDIPTYEGLYQVSNLGNVRSLNYRRTGNVKNLVLNKNSSGKKCVDLYKDGFRFSLYAHVLVAIAYLSHKPNGHKIVVDHINNKPLNNKLYNLQLITQRLNASKDRKGTSKHTGVCWDKNNNKWFVSIVINGSNKFLGRFTEEKDAAQAYQNELKKINETKETHTDTTHTKT